MKISGYNNLYELEKNNYAVNLVSGALLKVNDSKIIDLIKTKDDSLINKLFENEVEYLKKGRFIIDDNINELEILKNRYRNSNYNNKDQLLFTIIPTYNCNFNCSYCYQRQLEKIGYNYDSGIISEELLDSMEMYIKVATRKLTKFHIEWFGGEPLLVSNVIIDFNNRIKLICEENDCIFTSSVVTNGYLLNEKLTDKLYNSGVRDVLITIDGIENIHNKRRALKNGHGTYVEIIKNVAYASKYLNINLRVNIDYENCDNIIPMFEELKEIVINKNNITPIIVQTSTMGECENSTIQGIKLSEKTLKIISRTNEMGFNFKFNKITKKTTCVAKLNNKFVIDLNSKVYRCPSLAGHPDISDGEFNIEQSQIMLNYNGLLWNTWEPFDDKQCVECNYLPVCFGGCIHDEMIKNYTSEKVSDVARVKSKLLCKDHAKKLVELYVKKILIK